MLSLIALAATVGGYPAVCHTQASYAATGYGGQYVATPYVSAQAYQYAAPAYATKIVTAFVPVQQYDARYEVVGDAARNAAYAQQRLAADTNLVNAITGLASNLDKFRAQVAQATQAQDQAVQQRATQAPPPPVAQPSPQSPPDYAAPPPPPSLQAPPKATPSLPPVNVPPPPSDAAQGDPGTFPTQPTPAPFQGASNGPLSPVQQAATAVIGTRCGSCHTGANGSGGFAIMASKDRLASYAPEFLRMLDQVAYRGYVLRPDGTKLKMPPGGRTLNQDEWRIVHAASDEVDQSAALASNGQGAR